jgi:hypothetical protein
MPITFAGISQFSFDAHPRPSLQARRRAALIVLNFARSGATFHAHAEMECSAMKMAPARLVIGSMAVITWAAFDNPFATAAVTASRSAAG